MPLRICRASTFLPWWCQSPAKVRATRIAKRATVFEAIDSKPADDPRPNPDHRSAVRSRTDQIYAMREEIFGDK